MASGTICYFPQRDRIWYAGGRFVFWRGSSIHEHMDAQYDSLSESEAREVTFLSGCLMLFRTSVLQKIGFLNERLFMYFEDAEISVRAMRAGYRLLYVPNSRIYHKIHHQGLTPFTLYYGVRSRLIFIETVLSGWRRMLATTYFFAVLSVKMMKWYFTNRLLFKTVTVALQDYHSGVSDAGRVFSVARYPEVV
jgi:GT2 family glycosyltransferase